MAATTWIVVGTLVGLLLIVTIGSYNRLVTLRNRCHESWADVDTELRRRYALIPNLVSAARGYADHERRVFEEVTALRTRAMQEHGRPRDQEHQERPLVDALRRLVAIAEAQPELRASQNFLHLQHELAVTEDRIQAARRFYNANVRDYRDMTRGFPGLLFARAFRFEEEDFFQIDPIAVHPPQVDLAAPPAEARA